MHLLGTAGLRRAEACALLIGDIDERSRADDPRLCRAINGSTAWGVTVRYAKRGNRRHVRLEHAALEATTAWVRARLTCATEQLLASLPRSGGEHRPLTVPVADGLRQGQSRAA